MLCMMFSNDLSRTFSLKLGFTRVKILLHILSSVNDYQNGTNMGEIRTKTPNYPGGSRRNGTVSYVTLA